MGGLALATAERSRLLEESVVALPERPGDAEIVELAHKSLRLGSFAVAAAVEAGTNQEAEVNNLLDAVKLASSGTLIGKRIVKANAKADAVERTQKAGHVTKPVRLERDAAGEIHQYGHKMKQVQINAWRYATDIPQMKPRVVAENNNVFRLHEEADAGHLKDSLFFEVSMTADDMTKEDMEDVGFFTDTMTCMFRVTYEQNGELYMQNAMLAGVKKPNGDRHDKRAVKAVGKKIGANFDGMSAAEVINNPQLIKLNGRTPQETLIELVKLYDEADGTFFGEDKPVGDYEQVMRDSARLEADFESKVEAITNELIAAAAFMNTPADAARYLDKLSAKHMLQQSITDRRIDPRVFGPVAAADIELARAHYRQGNYGQVQSAINRAVANETSSSCPGGVGRKLSKGKLDGFSAGIRDFMGNVIGSDSDQDTDSGSSAKEKGVMKCVSCPKCRTYHEELRARGGKYTCKNDNCGHSVAA